MDSLLHSQTKTTNRLYTDPHNPHLHLARGLIYEQLGFPDLASADAYRALSLLESIVNPEECEFHARRRAEPIHEAELAFKAAEAAAAAGNRHDTDDEDEDEHDEGTFVPITKPEYDDLIGTVYELLVRNLVSCACFRDAFDFCTRGMGLFREAGMDCSLLQGQMGAIKRHYTERRAKLGREDSKEGDVDPRLLSAMGSARRVLYPWNMHEPDRKAPETVRLLNERVGSVAPKCEVKAVALPSLHGSHDKIANAGTDAAGPESGDEVSIQLGLFAKEDIPPGEILLRESSLLTATNRLHDDLCDACNTLLPELSAESPPVACDNCDDTIFCSRKCHDQAQDLYHGAICGREGLASIGRDIQDPRDKADCLYLLLLGRAMAMAATQGVHPLDLPEVKYIWGDFRDLDSSTNDTPTPDQSPSPSASLPFSFQLNILQPSRLLEEMGLDPFASLPLFDTWVLNTLYAKFRGTASGRLSTWDGGPELCAVHPLWCLANHSCDPNVRWEWGGEITFRARGDDERPVWKRGAEEKKGPRTGAGGEIKMGEEILNHYCDVGLGVKDRREWAVGALGGWCLCERCVWEDSV